MLRGNLARSGILFALLSFALVAISCGRRTPSEPDLPTRIVAVPTADIFANSPQLESRELLIDGRPTDIEWNVAGLPTVVLLHGDEGRGGDYFASVRALWTYNPFNQDSVALYLLLQWADPSPDVLEQPLVTSVNWTDDDGNTLVSCSTGDPLHDPANWHRNTSLHEDQVEVELFSDASGGYPADRWRWGAATTDPVTPVNPTEIPTADPEETQGAAQHPTGGWSEDYYNTGSGWNRDAGQLTYTDNFIPGTSVPVFITGKGTRDTRLNRGKPAALLIWRYVASLLGACDSINPIRADDASQREKTWNPGDYVISYLSGMPSGSQADVVSRGAWERGKWSLELRRLLLSRDPDPSVNTHGAPHLDDIELHSGRTYGIRIRVYNASKTRSSVSPILSLYLKPRS
jgi:hypothetical protein